MSGLLVPLACRVPGWLPAWLPAWLLALLLGGTALPFARSQEPLAAAREALGDPDRRVRQGAVKDLATLGSAAAWELVVKEGLRDESPRVADEAQLQIAGATFTASLREALESRAGLRSKEALVRQRLVEALGTCRGELPVEFFEKAAGDKEAEVRAALFRSVELRAQGGIDASEPKRVAGLVKTITRSAKSDRSPRARSNAMRAADALTRSAWVKAAPAADKLLAPLGDILRAALEDDEALVRAAAVAVLAAEAGDAGVDVLRSALRDPAPGVVATAIDMARDRGDRGAMSLLVVRLAEEEPPLGAALAARAVGVLRAASGLSHSTRATERWTRWVEGLDDAWRAPTERDREVEARDDDPRTTTFFGLPLVSDAVVFLVDMSGSMWSDREGPPRKLAVDAELSSALSRLPESARFDLVPYANAPAPWKGKLTPATPRNVERAIQSFRGSGLRGKGDVWSALLPALDDQAVDTIVVLTDGAATGGHRWNVRLMRTLLADRNRHRRAVIHVVLFDASQTLERLWREVAEDSGGVLHVID